MAAAAILKITKKSRYLSNGLIDLRKFGTMMQNGLLTASTAKIWILKPKMMENH